ncbi:sulfatase-like hydrolase/transferase [candidate division WOR-3 bacterium]|nr:sulfatase-like hydrolase/transferase [candidate division WOR-3 bacterium]
MVKKRKIGFILIALFLIIGGIVWYITSKPRYSNYSNVLIITCDALRVDHLSSCGYPRNTTPNIDKLANEGILFTQAIAQAAATGASLPSISTSTYPHTHGVLSWDMDECYLHDSTLQTLAKVLNNKGYDTGFITGHGGIAQFERNSGFETFINASMKANQVTRRAIDWLKKNRHRPFFLWLHYLEPHAPYKPPPSYNRMFVDDGLEIYHKQVPIKLIPVSHRKGDTTDVDYFVSQYDGEIKFADEEIGKLFNELKSLNLYDKTVIIFSADHGEHFGEHGLYFAHGAPFFEPVIRVPLVLKCNIPNAKGKTIHQQVQHIDIMPTLLDLLSIEGPSTMEGTSLLPLISGGEYPFRYAFSEEDWLGNMLFSIRTERWKLMYISGNVDSMIERVKKCYAEKYPEEYAITVHLLNKSKLEKYMLYDLKNDPEEQHNLASTEPDTLEFLKAELHIWMNQASSKSELIRPIIEQQKKERLRSLGYIQ